MSQVAYIENPHELERSVRDCSIILVAEKKESSQIYKEVIFPKETHHNKEMDSVYHEFYDSYLVKEVLFSSEENLLEKEIKVWLEPAYHMSSVQSYHEEDLLESPIVEEVSPRYALEGSKVVLFLEPHESIYRTFGGSAIEGADSVDFIKDLLTDKSNIKVPMSPGIEVLHSNEE